MKFINNYEMTQLNKAYYKKFKMLNKAFFKDKEIGLILLVEYLKYLRDGLVLEAANSLSTQEFTKTKIATLVAALAEFEAYKSNVDNKKIFHWNNFCELIKLNMEEWLMTNDSI